MKDVVINTDCFLLFSSFFNAVYIIPAFTYYVRPDITLMVDWA